MTFEKIGWSPAVFYSSHTHHRDFNLELKFQRWLLVFTRHWVIGQLSAGACSVPARRPLKTVSRRRENLPRSDWAATCM
jgi:hypothetical protein